MAPESPQDPQEFRQNRLAAAAKKAGGNAPLGRLLGYRDGAFVGQMLRGDRPITEKTVAMLESKPGYQGWFSLTEQKAHEPRNDVFNTPAPQQISRLQKSFLDLLGKLPLDEQGEVFADLKARASRRLGEELLAQQVDLSVFMLPRDRRQSNHGHEPERRSATVPAPPAAHRDPAVMKSPLTHKQVWPKSREGKA